MPLFISKRDANRRRRGIAVATAQVLYRLGFTVDDINSESDAIKALNSIHSEYQTTYGKANPQELASLIKSEGLDVEEFKNRLKKYRRTANRKLEKMEAEKLESIVSMVSKALMDIGAVDVKDADSIIESYARAAQVFKFPDGKNTIEYIKMLRGNGRFVNSVNNRLKEMQYENNIKEELQKFADEIYSERKIGGTIDQIRIYDGKKFEMIAEIGTTFVDQTFRSLETAKNTITDIAIREQKKTIRCTYCGEPHTLYSLVSGDTARCSCGALVRVTELKGPFGYNFEVKFMRNRPREPVPGYREFVKEISRHVYVDAIFTYSFRSETKSWDVRKIDSNTLFFGINAIQNSSFPKLFTDLLKSDNQAGVVLRTFTEKKDELTGYPIKELRGYLVTLVNKRLVYTQISAQEMARSNSIDVTTGKSLAAERGVVYCGPNDDYLDDNFKNINWSH
ncbi:MAG: hypothetical protein JRN26_00495 [Nitrososphaerota archaeon]|jgi:hypothetical protein|nr:hypothetical protein [Nitrososphaerota archaeon]MDG6927774.1 hypothetical protein [Nitrososphaerota archaeon]MDG6930313.1 hypothetical protein [Nitrososphaerota archaeon]MDG6932736.1 hypothetical protein [Nitrososphaerota archaeon]MDG6935359.1 hypothetical protein [Nitrososphaerota archaeon]